MASLGADWIGTGGTFLDYRTRWQERQRRRQMMWLVSVPPVIVILVIVVLLTRLLSPHSPDWSYAGPEDNIAAPSIAGNQVVAAFSEGSVHCLRLLDGSEVWPEPFRRPERFVSGVGVAAGTAVMCSDYGMVYACSMVDGRGVWNVRLSGSTRAAPLLVDDIAYVVTEDGEIRGYRADTGEPVLTVDTDIALSARPALHEGTLVAAGSDGVVIGIDATTGAERWRRRLSATFLCPVASIGGRIAIGSEQSRMYMFDPVDGRITSQLPAYGLLRNPAVGDETGLYYSDSEGYLYCADADSGKIRYSLKLGRTINAGPFLRGQNVYLVVDGTALLEMDVTTRDVRRRWRLGGDASRLSVGSGYAVVGTDSGRVAAVALD